MLKATDLQKAKWRPFLITQNLSQSSNYAALLTHQDTREPTSIAIDALYSAIGGVLKQFVNNTWQP